jgi:hypothetical protein
MKNLNREKLAKSLYIDLYSLYYNDSLCKTCNKFLSAKLQSFLLDKLVQDILYLESPQIEVYLKE